MESATPSQMNKDVALSSASSVDSAEALRVQPASFAHDAPPTPPFASIFREHHQYVCHTLRRVGIRSRDLEDVAHDVFVCVHRKLPEFEAGRPMKPWLFGIAFRIAAGHKRRKRETAEIPQDAPEFLADPRPLADEHMQDEQRRILVHTALDALSDEQRAVFVMHEIDNIGAPDIARELEIPLPTAYSRLRLAREGFEKALRRLAMKESP